MYRKTSLVMASFESTEPFNFTVISINNINVHCLVKQIQLYRQRLKIIDYLNN